MASPPTSHIITHAIPTERLDPFVVATGPSIPRIERIALFSEEQWEQFIDEWASNLPDYQKVERASGAGDEGCDVICFPVEGGALAVLMRSIPMPQTFKG